MPVIFNKKKFKAIKEGGLTYKDGQMDVDANGKTALMALVCDQEWLSDLFPPHMGALSLVSEAGLMIGKCGGADESAKHAIINYKDAQGKTVLMMAAERGHYNLVWSLLQMDADPNIQDKNGKTVLHHAVNFYNRAGRLDGEKKVLDIYQTCINYGANPNLFDKDSLFEKGKRPAEIVSLEHDRSGELRDCLLGAQQEHQDADEFIRKVLNNPRLVHVTDEQGMTALHHAANLNRIDDCKKLITYGANLSVIDYERGKTPEYYAPDGLELETYLSLEHHIDELRSSSAKSTGFFGFFSQDRDSSHRDQSSLKAAVDLRDAYLIGLWTSGLEFCPLLQRAALN